MVPKIAVVIYSKAEGAGFSANFRAFNLVEEMLEAEDEVVLVFDGAGVTALADILDTGHKLYRAYTKVSVALSGACRECAIAYGVIDTLEQHNVPLLKDYKGHMSLRRWLTEGYQLVTF